MSANMNETEFSEKVQAEISNLLANSAKLQAETAKLQKETTLYPFIVGASVTLAIVAVVKIFL